VDSTLSKSKRVECFGFEGLGEAVKTILSPALDICAPFDYYAIEAILLHRTPWAVGTPTVPTVIGE
jgi:hypothetical protein